MDCSSLNEKQNGTLEPYQHKAINAILDRSTFEHYCFLTRLTETPGQPRPEELAFAVKGLLRCNFRQASQGLEWRRLFGTTKRKWHEKKWQELPLSWRSRILFQTFQTQEEVKDFLACCPLRHWSLQGECPLVENLSAQEGNEPWVLLQVEDVGLDASQTFAQNLEKFLRNDQSIFKYLYHCSCSDLSKHLSNLAAAASLPNPELVSQPLKIVWQLQPQSLLHTGVSLDFAKSFFGQQSEPHSRNLRLSQPGNPAQLTPVLLVSSLKGVWRAALAWLCEALARQRGWVQQGQSLTTDYWPGKEWPADKACPVRAVFGGPLPPRTTAAGQGTTQDQTASARGLVRFLAPTGSYWPATAWADWCNERAKFRFARNLIGAQKSQKAYLHIETISLEPDCCVITEIQPGTDTPAALIALCLAADLISAGFFRLGRFTSRGFGVVRLLPLSVWQGTLVDLLEGRSTELPGAGSGIELLQKAFGIAAPLPQLAAWLAKFQAKSAGDES